MAAYTTIDDPTLHFQVLTYTGDGESTRALTLPGDTDMAPDLVWIKQRNTTRNQQVNDRVRGTSKVLLADLSDAEDATGGTVKAYGTDGFSVNDSANANEDSGTYVAWCWKANGTGSANTAGSINTAATSANTTAGFSINTYTGNSTSGATIGHGLGVKPAMIICKNLASTQDWLGYHESFGATKHIKLNQTEALGTASTRWNDTEPTTTLVTLGNDPQTNGSASMLAYCFANVQGYSRMGGYTVNGNADGAFIYTGFRPAFVMNKRTNSTANWVVHDNKRTAFNVCNAYLKPNLGTGDTDDSGRYIDLLSNGFKWRGTDTETNDSGSTYIYAAFAEAPFVNSNGVPCNAR